MTRLVDLSVPLEEGVAVYPGDPVFRSRPAATLATDGFAVLHVSMGSQTGTHVDAPCHVLAEGLPIDQLPLTRFFAPLVLADVRGLDARAPITAGALAPVLDRLDDGVALVLRTAWDAARGTTRYFDHPYLTPDAAAAVLDRGVRTIAVDAPNVDPTLLDTSGPADLPVHRLVAAAGGVLVENLTTLEGLDALSRPWLSVLPLRLTGADGAPCRAVAVEWP